MWAKAALVSHPVLERPVFTQFIGRVMDMEPLPARDIVRVTLHPQQRRDLPPVIRVNIAEKDVPQGLAVGSFISLRRSEEHTSELHSLMRISSAVFCLKKKSMIHKTTTSQL